MITADKILVTAGFFVILITAIIYYTAKDNYRKYIVPLNANEYSLKYLIPVGLKILDIIRYDFSGKYDMKLLRKISFIYGLDYSMYYLQIHIANKVVYSIITILLICFIGISSNVGYGYLVLLVIGPVVIYFLSDRLIDEKGEKRMEQIKRDFPDFVGKLTLLMEAGLNVRRAWEKIASDALKQTPLYMEIKRVAMDINSGKPELEAYREFSERTKIKEINRLMGIIIQNIKIGGSAILKELNLISYECWELRKNNANKLAEEAQTKLTFPMMLMFVAVLLVVMVPAVLSMRGF